MTVRITCSPATGRWPEFMDAPDRGCAGRGIEPWYPEDSPISEREHLIDVALARCSMCPFMEACGTWAIDVGERFGSWGGMSPARRQFVKKNPPGTVVSTRIPVGATHGVTTYTKHRCRCEICVAAKARVRKNPKKPNAGTVVSPGP